MKQERPLQGLRVLVVEDQYFIASELQSLVEQLGGAAVGPARSVDIALRLIEAEHPDLAILDVNLDGGHVYPVAEALTEAGKPFLFATGYEAWALDARFAAVPVVEKPVTLGGLSSALLRLQAPSKVDSSL